MGDPERRARQELEEALRASEARLAAVVESLPLDFWMIGQDGTYVMQNSSSRELWGDVTGKRPRDVVDSEETLALWEDNNRRAFAGEVVSAEVQFPVDGEPRHFFNVVSPIRDADRVIGILGINLDITERKRAEEALQARNAELSRANAELERLSRAKDRVTAMISHELRTPLVTGLGYVDMLLEGKLGALSDKIRSRMRVAQRNLRRLTVLIDSVLRYHELISPESPEQVERLPFDLGHLVAEVTGELADSLDSARRLQVEVAPGLPWALGDEELIRMTLTNLLNNAVVHAGGDAAIRVEVRRTAAGTLRVTVSDTGPGIGPELRDAVFEPFVKDEADKKGYGLGLAVVRAIVRAHRSEVELESEPGHGTRISFELQAAAA